MPRVKMVCPAAASLPLGTMFCPACALRSKRTKSPSRLVYSIITTASVLAGTAAPVMICKQVPDASASLTVSPALISPTHLRRASGPASRDGYAVRSSEAGPDARLKCVGEIKAGDTVREALASGTCLQIMTGAAVPANTDAVVMIEYTSREGDFVRFERNAQAGQNIVPRGSEAAAGQTILTRGMRLGFAELALAAQVGAGQLQCGQRPRGAILSTGDGVGV